MRDEARVTIEDALLAFRVTVSSILAMARAGTLADVERAITRASDELQDIAAYVEEERRDAAS